MWRKLQASRKGSPMFWAPLWIPGHVPQVVPPHYHYNPSRPSSPLGRVTLETTFVADPRERGTATQATSVCQSQHPNLTKENHSSTRYGTTITYSGSHMTIYQIGMYLSSTNRPLGKIDKKNEHSSRRRETTRARSRPLLLGSGGARKVRHVQYSAHREVDFISI